MVYSGNKGLHREDTLDEYFEYEAEEFLVSLALLITEGRTPEFSVKGRTEGFHCPPAQSSQPLTSKHECTDKLAQCRQARRTRSEVMLLWKNNIPIMIEVMLLPDCCYSDEGPTTEGSDLNDPAIKQDALLLERWILEPVPRQSGDRFIEEKTLLLAVRSFVFFSQLSAWLSVSHGAVPRNILYRVSAADVDLQWTFSQTPAEHVFPVPNVSHNVALKVSVQSLPRQSNYPVLTCSIHTSLGFYEKGIQEHNVHQHCDSIEGEQRNMSSSQRSCGKQTWTLIPEGLLNAKISPEFTTSVRNVKLYPATGFGSAFGTSQSKAQCYNAMGDNKTQPHETSVRTFKSFSLVDPQVPNSHCSRQPIGETNPLIGSLLLERQEVIARIAQHLIHCDPSTSHVTGCPFNMHETSSKVFWNTYEDETLLKKGKETSSVSTANTNIMLSEDCREDKTRAIPENPLVDSHVLMNHCSRQSIGETNPLISSLLLERQEVIARIVQHLIHCDPATSHITGRPFNIHESSSITSKVFQSSYEDEILLKKGKETSSVSFSKSAVTIKDSSKVKTRIPDTPLTYYRLDGELKASPKPQARRKLILAKPSEVVQNTFQQTPNKTTNSFTSINISCSKENKSELPDTLETVSGCPHKDQMTNKGIIGKQCSNFNTTDEQICKNKLKERTIMSENSNGGHLINPQLDKYKILESTKKVTLMQASDILHKNELKCLDKDPKKPNVCDQNTQLVSIENYLNKDHDSFKCKNKQDKLKTAHDENEDPTDYEFQSNSQKKSVEDYLARCQRLKNADVLRIPPLKHSSIWRKRNFHSLDGTVTKAFHPRTGLPLLSSPVPQRKTQSGCFDLDSSLLRLKCLSTRSTQQYINTDSDPEGHGKPFLSSSAPPITSLSLLGNFEESVLNYRLDPLGIVDGFTAEVGASGVFCPTHMTLPVEVSFYSVSDDNAPSPYMGVITLETLGKRGYRVPPSGTIQVTLFNPNKTVVKMFVVIYDLREMPANHQTFLRQRTFSVPVRREVKRSINKENIRQTEERLLRYLVHLRFQSSKSGKIYLHRDVRLLFSRKSMEVDSGAAYELKSYTESPTNPQFSPRC
ncbi:protein FAM214A isoform X1 [Dermochelys coriacea]|uniref:protein FAM214A isoform X1 n=2 Tax=Dermochelys coriacea TaxID=27794 RepID=UPI0018E7AE57|nr:protein FAM214A isoform X1 [Dermochelys coriacea]